MVVPFFTSFLIRTLAWQTVLGRRGPGAVGCSTACSLIGVARRRSGSPSDGRLLATHAAVIGGLTYNFLPFMILPIYVSLEKIDLRPAPRRPRTSTQRLAGLPQGRAAAVAAGVFAGSLLTFIPAAGDFINAEFLGGPNNTMIGTVVQDRFLVQATYPTAAALSFILMVIITDRRAHLRPRPRHGRPRLMARLARPRPPAGRVGRWSLTAVAVAGLRLPVHRRSS